MVGLPSVTAKQKLQDQVKTKGLDALKKLFKK